MYVRVTHRALLIAAFVLALSASGASPAAAANSCSVYTAATPSLVSGDKIKLFGDARCTKRMYEVIVYLDLYEYNGSSWQQVDWQGGDHCNNCNYESSLDYSANCQTGYYRTVVTVKWFDTSTMIWAERERWSNGRYIHC